MNLDSWIAYLTRDREFSRPSPPFTFDWGAARGSIEKLADLEPGVVAAGHGLAMSGEQVACRLREFTKSFTPPRRGRYLARPPVAGEDGVEELPPPVPDPYARGAGACVACLMLLALARRLARRRGR
jgi:hypothetical protein